MTHFTDQEFQTLLQNATKDLYVFCKVLTRSTSEINADDLFQQIMLKMWKNRQSLYDYNIVKWGRIIACNEHKSMIRQTLLRQNRETEYNSLTETKTPENAQEVKIFLKEVVDSIEKLPNYYKEVFIKLAIEKKQQREVAKEFKIPLGTVCSRFARARTILKEKFK